MQVTYWVNVVMLIPVIFWAKYYKRCCHVKHMCFILYSVSSGKWDILWELSWRGAQLSFVSAFIFAPLSCLRGQITEGELNLVFLLKCTG